MKSFAIAVQCTIWIMIGICNLQCLSDIIHAREILTLGKNCFLYTHGWFFGTKLFWSLIGPGLHYFNFVSISYPKKKKLKSFLRMYAYTQTLQLQHSSTTSLITRMHEYIERYSYIHWNNSSLKWIFSYWFGVSAWLVFAVESSSQKRP